MLRIHPKVEHLRNFGNISGSGSGMFTITNGFADFVNAIAKVRNRNVHAIANIPGVDQTIRVCNRNAMRWFAMGFAISFVQKPPS